MVLLNHLQPWALHLASTPLCVFRIMFSLFQPEPLRCSPFFHLATAEKPTAAIFNGQPCRPNRPRQGPGEQALVNYSRLTSPRSNQDEEGGMKEVATQTHGVAHRGIIKVSKTCLNILVLDPQMFFLPG